MNNVLSRYKTDINGLRQLGMIVNTTDDGNYFVIIDSQHRNLLPEFAFNISEANKEVPGTIGGWMKNKFTTKVDETNYHGYGWMGTMGDSGLTKDPYIELVSLYNKGLETASKAEEKIGLSKGTRSYNIGSYESFGAAFAALYPHLIPANETTTQYVDRQNKQVDNMFANGMFSAGNILFEDESGYAHKDLSKNIDAKNLIQSMYSDATYRNKVTRSIKVPSGSEAGYNQGYKLVFIVPEGLGNDSFKEGEKVSMIVSGTTAEESNFNPALNPDVIATNAITISKSTQGNVDIMGYNSELGLTDLLYNKKDDNYNIGFGGINKYIDESEAIKYTTAMYTLQYLKSEVYAGLYDIYSEIGQDLLNNKINNIAIPISNVTNKDVNEVKRIILNYLSTPED